MTVDDDKSVSKLFLCWGFRECSKVATPSPWLQFWERLNLRLQHFPFSERFELRNLVREWERLQLESAQEWLYRRAVRPRLTWSEEAGHALSTLLGLNKSNFCRHWKNERKDKIQSTKYFAPLHFWTFLRPCVYIANKNWANLCPDFRPYLSFAWTPFLSRHSSVVNFTHF